MAVAGGPVREVASPPRGHPVTGRGERRVATFTVWKFHTADGAENARGTLEAKLRAAFAEED